MATKMIVMRRDAEKGTIVSRVYAEKHPKTTTIEHRNVPVCTPAKPSGVKKR